VLVDGELFTSYLHAEGGALRKPVLHPLRLPGGVELTRGHPPRPGERTDHPHHVGVWLSYGHVDGLDFWNHSGAVPPAAASKYGTIVHRGIDVARGGAGEGELVVRADWLRPDGTAVLRERTWLRFGASGERRWIDRVTVLASAGGRVSLDDNKEGLFGLRLARELEHASARPGETVPGATLVPTGRYTSSEGVEGAAVWGTRGRWVRLSGRVAGQAVAVAILDHPENPGHPTHWHARDYGLFAANPLGQRPLSGGARSLGFALEPGASGRFAFRLVVARGELSREELEAEHARFAARPR
jgi:hypothetical protein